jgi:hypothetical protein
VYHAISRLVDVNIVCPNTRYRFDGKKNELLPEPEQATHAKFEHSHLAFGFVNK